MCCSLFTAGTHSVNRLVALTIDPHLFLFVAYCCRIFAQVYRRLMEIESRLLPYGLHTVGVLPTALQLIPAQLPSTVFVNAYTYHCQRLQFFCFCTYNLPPPNGN